jgi:hypothetical protein
VQASTNRLASVSSFQGYKALTRYLKDGRFEIDNNLVLG